MDHPTNPKKKILLLSAYDAQSHRMWRQGIVQQFEMEYDFTVLSLPPRSFSWRVRGNAYSWTMKYQHILTQHYDLILATSMTDLSTLRGLNPQITKIPTIVYFHENQFVYPIQNEIVQREVFHFCMLNLYTAMCAERLLFNSEYNRNSFLQGILDLLRKMPDYAPKSVVDIIAEKSFVLPVPLPDQIWTNKQHMEPLVSTTKKRILKIIWNHRWEYDKDPETFFEALTLLQKEHIPFELYLLGQKFRDVPSCFVDAQQQFQHEIRQYGFVESRQRYEEILQQGDVVVSTAIHEFQGLAMIEAIAFGCTPIAPNHLVYPEYIPKDLLFESDSDRSIQAQSLSCILKKLYQSHQKRYVDVQQFSWAYNQQLYKKHFVEICGGETHLDIS